MKYLHKCSWRRKTLALLTCVSAAYSGTLTAQPAESTAAQSAESTAAQPAESTALLLRIDGNSVSADIRDVPLEDVVKEAAFQAAVKVHLPVSVGETKISATFDEVPLEEAIKRILRHTSYVLLSPEESQTHDRRLVVHVLASLPGAPVAESEDESSATDQPSEASGQDHQWSDGEMNNSITELDLVALQALEPSERVAALEVLVEEHGEDSFFLIMAASEDPDAEVRSASLKLMLKDLGEFVPRDRLSQLALRGESSEVRVEALELLASHHGEEEDIVRSTLQLALEDSDPNVQNKARGLLNLSGGANAGH